MDRLSMNASCAAIKVGLSTHSFEVCNIFVSLLTFKMKHNEC